MPLGMLMTGSRLRQVRIDMNVTQIEPHPFQPLNLLPPTRRIGLCCHSPEGQLSAPRGIESSPANQPYRSVAAVNPSGRRRKSLFPSPT